MSKKNIGIIGIVAVILIIVGLGFNSMFAKGSDAADAPKTKIESSAEDKNKLKTELDDDSDKEESKEDEDKDKEEEAKKDENKESDDKVAGNSETPNEDNSNNTSGNNTQTDTNEKPESTPAPVVPKKDTVTIAIDCVTAINNGVNNQGGFTHLPSSGVILGTKTVEIQEGDTVFNVLQKVVRDNGIHMEYTGSGSTIYIEGIHNLYEFDGGKDSGWMYSVNGWYPNYGAGVYKLKANDVIKWRYTCNLGADLGRGMN